MHNRRSSRNLPSKRGSRASAKQRRGPHIADCRVWSATVEICEFSHFRASFLTFASGCRDAGLMSLRRSIVIVLLNIVFEK